jgi:hypothetical protein
MLQDYARKTEFTLSVFVAKIMRHAAQSPQREMPSRWKRDSLYDSKYKGTECTNWAM